MSGNQWPQVPFQPEERHAQRKSHAGGLHDSDSDQPPLVVSHAEREGTNRCGKLGRQPRMFWQ